MSADVLSEASMLYLARAAHDLQCSCGVYPKNHRLSTIEGHKDQHSDGYLRLVQKIVPLVISALAKRGEVDVEALAAATTTLLCAAVEIERARADADPRFAAVYDVGSLWTAQDALDAALREVEK